MKTVIYTDNGKKIPISHLPETEYHVMWSIDINARTPQEAAEKAKGIQKDTDNIANSFMVESPEGTEQEIDLNEEDIKCYINLVKCSVCGSLLNGNENFREHLITHHPQAKSFTEREVLDYFPLVRLFIHSENQ